MGHCIEALIARVEPLRFGLSSLRHACVVPLARGLGLAPVTDALFDEITAEIGESGDDPYPEFWKLSASLAALAVRLSRSSPTAYIETDYHGGVGTQAAIAWDGGRVAVGPFKTGDETL